MDFKRAEEIINSPEKIEVIFEGKSIWIHNLNLKDKTAVISLNNETKEILDVPVNTLTENN